MSSVRLFSNVVEPDAPPSICHVVVLVSFTVAAHAVCAIMSIITSSNIAARRVAPSPKAKGAKKIFLILIFIVYYDYLIFECKVTQNQA